MDLDQTAPWSSLIKVQTVCLKLENYMLCEEKYAADAISRREFMISFIFWW